MKKDVKEVFKKVVKKTKEILKMDVKDIVKKRKVQISFLVIVGISIIALVYSAFFAPTALNKLVASKLYKSPANSAFKDQNFYNCVVDEYNTDKSASGKVAYTYELSDEQLRTVNMLSCNGSEKSEDQKISDTSGVEKLTNLKNLELISNNIRNIDLTNNSKLEDLFISFNKLEYIDLSSNSSLDSVFLGGNKLTNLSLPENLRYLSLDTTDYVDFFPSVNNGGINKTISRNSRELTNNIESLDLSSIHSLRVLSAKNIGLKEIKLNNEISNIEMPDNNLDNKNLNLSNFPNLWRLNVSGTGIESLNVSNSNNLKDLQAVNNNISSLNVSGCSALKEVWLADNNLKSINLNDNINLEELNLYANPLKQLNLSNNVNLKSLVIGTVLPSDNTRKTEITDLDLSLQEKLELIHLYPSNLEHISLNANNNIQTFMSKENPLTRNEFMVLFNENLTNLDIRYPGFESIDLSNVINLEELIITGDNNLKSINLRNNVALKNLQLVSNGLNDIDISQNVNLERLYLGSNKLHNLDLSRNTNLKHLGLGDNDLSSIDVSRNINLAGLNLYNNKLSSIDLTNNTVLEEINLSGNPLNKTQSLLLGKKTIIDSPVKLPETSNLPTSWYNTTYEAEEGSGAIIEDNNVTAKKLKDFTVREVNSRYAATINMEVIAYSSDKYDLKKDYIDIGTTEFNIEDIEVSESCTKEIVTDENGNRRLVIKYENEEIGSWDIVSYKSTKYNLNQPYILVGLNDLNLDDIEVSNCTKEIAGNKLLIKYGDEIKDYIILSYKSDKYDLSKNYIYLGNNDLSLDSIETSGFDKQIEDNKLVLKYYFATKEYDLLTLSSDKYFISKTGIYYGEEPVSVEEFKNNIETDLEIKVFRNDVELTTGNISYGDVVKVYSNTYGEVHSYTLVEEYLDVSKLDIDNNVIEKVKVGDSFKDIKDKIDTTGTIKLIDKDNNEVEDTTGRSLRTGDTIRIELSNEVEEYQISISGDVNGSGKIDVGDLSKVLTDVMDVEKIEGECYQKAADYNEDGRLGVGDLSKLLTKLMGGESNE
ncbi:MAG: hypothetical protein IJF92_03110 [Bacilli bacterium]|nr:hypothetical protein [Bacilli bacterium]